ncbi:MAG: conjugative transfer signal peptidase TraF [Pseudomonadota bacterium]
MKTWFICHLRAIRRDWQCYALLTSIWLLAMVRVLIDPTPRLPILFNVTPSLPYLVAVVDYGARGVGRGDYVIFAFRGDAVRHFPGLRGQPFFKRVAGVAGDLVEVRERRVFVNGVEAGFAKRFATVSQLALEPIAVTVIPAGYLYMQGANPDSFDSRYMLCGLVATSDVLAVVRPLF